MTNNSTKVCVLLATYNGTKWCLDQVKSILNQEDVNLEVFVSDDLSSDSTTDLLALLNDSRIHILASSYKFGSACQNFFRLVRDVDFSEYDYIAFADQDDLWNPNKLSYSIEQLNAHCADAFSSNVTAFWPDGRARLIVKDQPQREWDFLFESAGPGCTFVLTKKLACNLANFLHNNYEKTKGVALHDWFTYAFARSNSYSWWIDSQPTMMYRQHESNEFGVNSGVTAALSRFRKTSNGWYRNQVILIGDLVGAEDSWPIKRMRRFSLLDRMLLLFNVFAFRRSFRDRIALFFLLLLPQKK
ncbi:glycosyl transferase family 2 [Geobacter metallireducens RCH3]|uniref:Glycosyltransferase n=1 Tax=Geobacter metallireducens (strain ATCC 53774 / DSM 7210 / GS-15) TaxID=269799 RepID=Q39W05_GEOMG|nr:MULTISPECIES: glycosyltransferase [Geobacter]ABB31569.1 glycosyltransferase [Geobacter metallireducens GS-15]EHP86669.1 glycosyl transferase family 2 [Geobacter metallireducens RCH3]MBT1075484.1 glycosyltransferase [Geobacter grbiciae]